MLLSVSFHTLTLEVGIKFALSSWNLTNKIRQSVGGDPSRLSFMLTPTFVGVNGDGRFGEGVRKAVHPFRRKLH